MRRLLDAWNSKRRKLAEALVLLPIFIYGVGFGCALSVTQNPLQPLVWNHATFGGIAGLLFIITLVWIYGVTE